MPLVVGTRINKLTPQLLAQLPAEARNFLQAAGASSAAIAIIFPNNALEILAKEGVKALMAKTSLWLAGVPDGRPFNPSSNPGAPSTADPFTRPFQDAAYVMNIKGDGTIDFRAGWGYLNDVRPQNALQGRPVVVSDPVDPDTWGFVNIGITGRVDRNPTQAILGAMGIERLPDQKIKTVEVGGVVTAGLMLRVPGSEQLAHGLGAALTGFGNQQNNPVTAWGLGTFGALLQSSTGFYAGAAVVPTRDTATLVLDGLSPNGKLQLSGSVLGAKGKRMVDFSSDTLPERQSDLNLNPQTPACPPTFTAPPLSDPWLDDPAPRGTPPRNTTVTPGQPLLPPATPPNQPLLPPAR